eukprot:s1634_g21.t1
MTTLDRLDQIGLQWISSNTRTSDIDEDAQALAVAVDCVVALGDHRRSSADLCPKGQRLLSLAPSYAMVSPLNDAARAKKLSRLMHGWLSEDLQLSLPKLESTKGRIYTFAAFLGVLRASSPIFKQRKALRDLAVRCPLSCRFPTTHTGKLIHYEDVHAGLTEVVDTDDGMNNDKMWRFLVWIFLGNGGHQHHAWKAIRNTWATRRYVKDRQQPLSVLCFVSTAVCRLGGVMKVIGSDGLDKKFRLSQDRFLWLCEWHAAVPQLVAAFHESPERFRQTLKRIKGLGGDLSQKEVLILLGASRHRRLREVGQSLLPFGQGARNGALVFLGIPLKQGKTAAQYYERELTKHCSQMEEAVRELFPSLPKEMCKVSLGDIEPCLCGAFIYAKQVERLRKTLPCRWTWFGHRSDDCWAQVEKLPVPAGFIPYGRDGRPESLDCGAVAKIMAKCPKRTEPVRGRLTKRRLLRLWKLESDWPSSSKRVLEELASTPQVSAWNEFEEFDGLEGCGYSEPVGSLRKGRVSMSRSARAVQCPTGSSRDTPPSTEAACRGPGALPEARRDGLSSAEECALAESAWREMTLQFLLAITLAAVSISFLTSTGIISRCPMCASAEYGACAAAQLGGSFSASRLQGLGEFLPGGRLLQDVRSGFYQAAADVRQQ